MKIKLGDFVMVLDDDLSGVVKSVVGNTIGIETQDGFLMEFDANELILQTPLFRRHPALPAELPFYPVNITGV